MATTTAKPDARPLYVQVKDILVDRIQSGTWAPGQMLPSEFRIADELGVSQGTVRKALDALADASIVQRRQGRGTFVVEHTPADVLFKFFQIYDVRGERVLPDVGPTRMKVVKASPSVARSLILGAHDPVIEIQRVRTHQDKPFITEQIYLAQSRFEALIAMTDVPNTLYDLFQREFGITIARVEESLRAVGATKDQANRLGVVPNTPLLRIDRVAFDLEADPIELRISHCLTDGYRYQAKLG